MPTNKGILYNFGVVNPYVMKARYDYCYNDDFKDWCVNEGLLPLTCYTESILTCDDIEKDFRLEFLEISNSKDSKKLSRIVRIGK